MIKFFIITAITEVIFELFFGNKFRRWLKSTKFYQKMVHACAKAIDRNFSNARRLKYRIQLIWIDVKYCKYFNNISAIIMTIKVMVETIKRTWQRHQAEPITQEVFDRINKQVLNEFDYEVDRQFEEAERKNALAKHQMEPISLAWWIKNAFAKSGIQLSVTELKNLIEDNGFNAELVASYVNQKIAERTEGGV